MKKFNELFDLVKKDMSPKNVVFYKKLFYGFYSNGGITGKKKKIVQLLFEEVIVRHGLGDKEDIFCMCR